MDLAGGGHRRSAVVVGGGIVGLSTAWFLQDRGIDVTIVERSHVGEGASWGNAGWLTPSRATPLPEPSALREGLSSLLHVDAPFSIPRRPDPDLWNFLLRFARHCTPRAWKRGVAAYVDLNAQALAAYDELVAAGVDATIHPASVTACFPTREGAQGFSRKLIRIRDAGQEVDFIYRNGDEVRAALPQASDRVVAGVEIRNQRFIDPGDFVAALADSVRARDGAIIEGFTAQRIRRGSRGNTVDAAGGGPVDGDVVVVATGAWIDQLARPLGVRQLVRAGRGYSVTVPSMQEVPCPIYFPSQRVACTPYKGALRVTSLMDFEDADAPWNPHRIGAVLRPVADLLTDVDLGNPSDPWVGPRPVSVDGLPLIGATRMPGVYVAGGHGMWGITQGPVTGQLLAEQIATGTPPMALAPFDPLR